MRARAATVSLMIASISRLAVSERHWQWDASTDGSDGTTTVPTPPTPEEGATANHPDDQPQRDQQPRSKRVTVYQHDDKVDPKMEQRLGRFVTEMGLDSADIEHPATAKTSLATFLQGLKARGAQEITSDEATELERLLYAALHAGLSTDDATVKDAKEFAKAITQEARERDKEERRKQVAREIVKRTRDEKKAAKEALKSHLTDGLHGAKPTQYHHTLTLLIARCYRAGLTSQDQVLVQAKAKEMEMTFHLREHRDEDDKVFQEPHDLETTIQGISRSSRPSSSKSSKSSRSSSSGEEEEEVVDSWGLGMAATYGEEWNTGRGKAIKILDKVRCWQWSKNKPVSRDPFEEADVILARDGLKTVVQEDPSKDPPERLKAAKRLKAAIEKALKVGIDKSDEDVKAAVSVLKGLTTTKAVQEFFDGFDEAYGPDELGRWGCLSALMREGFLGMLAEGKAAAAETAQSLAELKANTTDEGGSSSGWVTKSLKPDDVCGWRDGYSGKKGRCEVTLFAPEEFLQLMSKQAQPNGKVTGPDVGADISAQVSLAIDSGPIVSFNPGAGKSKSTFARTSDDQFKIKLGLKDDLTMDEPENLRKLLHSSKTLIQYLRDNPNSLLNRVYGIIRVTFADTNTYVILMSDAAYGQDKKLAERSDVRFEKYDLKGRSRNDLAAKNKPGSSTLINGEFMDWEGNTMHLSNNHCRRLQDVVKRDAEFLALHNLIDYSLFVTVATASLWESAEPLVVPVKLDHISLPGVVVSSTFDNTAAVVDQVDDHGYIPSFNKGLKEFGFVQGDAVRAVRAGDVITSVCHSDGVCAGTFDNIQDKLLNPPIGENFSIHVRRKQEPLGCGGTPGEPFCFESTQPHLDKRLGKMVLKTYTISIIDYLNQRNWFKRAEELVPRRYGKFSNYDGKIVDFVTEVCPVGLDDHVSDSFVILPTGASQHAESSS